MSESSSLNSETVGEKLGAIIDRAHDDYLVTFAISNALNLVITRQMVDPHDFDLISEATWDVLANATLNAGQRNTDDELTAAMKLMIDRVEAAQKLELEQEQEQG